MARRMQIGGLEGSPGHGLCERTHGKGVGVVQGCGEATHVADKAMHLNVLLGAYRCQTFP